MATRKWRPSYDYQDRQIRALKQILPEVFSDGYIDFETLRDLLGEHLEDDSVEPYGLNWPGKREARRLAAHISRAALVQVSDGVNENSTRNVFIEGDNLEVLKLLQKAYAGRVALIYIDPPYNTGNDFIYRDNYQSPLETYLKDSGLSDEEGQLLVSNPQTSGRYHSNWLNMLYPRLILARNLLSEAGVVVVSIDDNEVANLRLLLDEVFGPEAFIAQLVWKSRKFPDARAVTHISTDHEYLLVYARNPEFRFRGIERDESKFSNPDNDLRGLWMSRSILGLATAEQRPNLHYAIIDPATGNSFAPPPDSGWRYSKERMQDLIDAGAILFPSNPDGRPREKKFRKDLMDEYTSFPSIITDVHTSDGTAEIREIFGFNAFDFPKPSELVRRLVEQLTDEDDIVLDFFAGSGTTGHAVYLQDQRDFGSRRFILVQLDERVPPDSELAENGYSSISQLSKERLRRVIVNLSKQMKEQKKFEAMSVDTDLGFRSFRLTNSSFREWKGYDGDNLEALEHQMDLFESPLFEGWQVHDVLIEVLLQEGFPLDSIIALRDDVFTENQVFFVESDSLEYRLYICLDEYIEASTAEYTMQSLDDRDVFICLDSALSDQSKMRLSDRANLHVI